VFAKDAPVAMVQSKKKNGKDTKYNTSPDDVPLVAGIPIILLVNSDTIGGGEMIASALQDNKVALVAGQPSFGKGSVQSSYTLPNTSIPFKMTTGLIYRPNGKPLQRMPDAKPGDAWGRAARRGAGGAAVAGFQQAIEGMDAAASVAARRVPRTSTAGRAGKRPRPPVRAARVAETHQVTEGGRRDW